MTTDKVWTLFSRICLDLQLASNNSQDFQNIMKTQYWFFLFVFSFLWVGGYTMSHNWAPCNYLLWFWTDFLHSCIVSIVSVFKMYVLLKYWIIQSILSTKGFFLWFENKCVACELTLTLYVEQSPIFVSICLFSNISYPIIFVLSVQTACLTFCNERKITDSVGCGFD